MACVSATLHLDLPTHKGAPNKLQQAKRALRDLRYNPQRNLPAEEALAPIWKERSRAVERSAVLRATDPDHRIERRKTFERIRALGAEALALRPGELATCEQNVRVAAKALEQYEIQHNREYFFGLYDRDRLERLLDALPREGEFRV
jgi:hypothetical protein